MIIRHKDLLRTLKNNHKNKKFIIFGLSEIVKKLLQNEKVLYENISCIVDNNFKNLPKYFMNIPIISINHLDKNNHIILLGGYVQDLKEQLNNLNINNIYIDYEYTKRNTLLPIDFKFKIEVPNQTINPIDTSHIFTQQLLQNLLLFYRPINIAPIEFNINYHLRKRTYEKNELLISYHSISDSSDKNIIRWKEGYLAKMITFDNKGYSGWSSLCDENIKDILKNISQEKANHFFNKFAEKYITTNQSKYKQPDNNNFDFPKNFIFFPLQTIHDSVMKHSYIDPIKLIKNIIQILYKLNTPLVIKRHPRCNNIELSKLLIKYRNKIITYDGSIHTAISKAKTVYTINSGVGFEALLHLKPVVTFGKSDYMSLTKNIKYLDEVKLEPFYELSDINKNMIKRFLYYYINEKCFFLGDKEKLQKVVDKFIIEYLNNLNGL